MHALLPTTLFLTFLGASAVPQSAAPIRVLPCSWQFEIVDLKGPGCKTPEGSPFTTRSSYGTNTMDGSEIYYWFFAYPSMQASVGKDVSSSHTWCETTLSYKEFKGCGETGELAADYRLRPHKNATDVLAVYDLEEGVEADWKFTYYLEDEEEVYLFPLCPIGKV
jgi:hypothetical protein